METQQSGWQKMKTDFLISANFCTWRFILIETRAPSVSVQFLNWATLTAWLYLTGTYKNDYNGYSEKALRDTSKSFVWLSSSCGSKESQNMPV